MNAPLAVLCADEASLQHPRAIGLPEENLVAQEWLRLFSSGEDARRFLGSDVSVDEVWVASSDDVEPINLAASLKRDRPGRRVCLLAFDGTGSLRSRAARAGIDATLTRQAFAERYAQRKRRRTDVRAASAHSPRSADPTSDRGVRPYAASLRTTTDEPAAEAKGARPMSRPQEKRSVRRAFLLPVVSGGGGAGKSTVAVLSAVFAQRFGYKTLLIDLDLQFGDAAAMLGMRDALTVDEALASSERFAKLTSEGTIPAVIAAPRRLEDSEEIENRTGELLDRVSSDFDVIVVNTGTAWTEQHATLLERSSKALFLVDQRASSLRACQHALDLCARCGIATGPFQILANRCARHAPYTSLDMSCALGGISVLELQDGGRDVEEFMGAGLSADLAQTRNPLCASLERMLVGLLPRSANAHVDIALGRSQKGMAWGLFKNKRRKVPPCPC